ncbi:hypothetical protein SCHPADRAFT_851670 [Schizopora paradoxa]|uniref:Histone deacetylase interacting domain-containing protein n=1 Tax=Schizopora paradoxa TaxID=27342 RepID=A0A0H2RR02_9AGAM|nr:hypothetical protein SCHPADRAFT_851670 [Schizopora paradoxa]
MDTTSPTTEKLPTNPVTGLSDRTEDMRSQAEISGRARTPVKVNSSEERMQPEAFKPEEISGPSLKMDRTSPEVSTTAMDVDMGRGRNDGEDSSRRISGADYYTTPGVFAKDFGSAELMADAQNDGIVDPQNPSSGGPESKQLNVTDALSYLDAVKQRFHDQPDVYNRFLDIMKDFKSQNIDTPGVIERVSNLFSGNPELIQGFNTFLPVGYRIECSLDAHDRNRITVTTPEGTTMQTTTGFAPEPNPNSLIMTALAKSASESLPYTHEQISPAIEYVTKIKQRFADHTDLYQEFLDILSLYKRSPIDQAHLTDRIAKLFKNAPDLLPDFQVFMPGGVLPNAEVLGALDESTVAEKLMRPGKYPSKRASKGGDTASVAGSSGAPKRKRRPVGGEKEKEVEKDKDVKLSQGKAKRQRYPPLAAAPEPSYTPYAPPSPQPHPQYPHAGPSSAHSTVPMPVPYEVPPPPAPPAAVTSQDELYFFDRVRRALDNRETYNEFLKLINLFTQDIIDMRRLVEKSFYFLGQGELMAQFKEILGWDSAWDVSTFALANDANGLGGLSESMQRPTKADLSLRYGPSYRKLPASEVDVPCSGRDEMCKSVLNDEWVSHPNWASEDSGFVAHRKNIYEEALHRSEEERHEYDFHIEAITRTIAMLDPINAKIMQVPPEERAAGKFKTNFAGASKAIYHRTIKKVYGRDAGLEVIRSLVDCAGLAVPIVLSRLKQKEEEWKKAQREWNKVWREVDAKNYQKSLDHQGISFKANDKKAITMKAFINQIELAREEQMSKRASLIDPSLSRTRPRYQLAFVLEDTDVLQDVLKLTFSFLDRMQHHYTFPERRRVEAFLRLFFPMFFMLDSASFNAKFKSRNVPDSEFTKFDDFSGFVVEDAEEIPSGAGPSRDGRSKRRGGGNDLRKKLLKSSAQGGSASRRARAKSSSLPTSRLASPAPLEAMAVDEQPEVATDGSQPVSPSSENQPQYQKLHRRGTFFANSALYTLLRLVEVLYSRLLSCKQLAAQLANDPSSPYIANPVAAKLALLDMDAPDPGLRNLQQQKTNAASYFYDYLLASCERLFDNEIDQQTFEDICRYMFGTKAYVMFTIDKVISSFLKQVQFILSDKSIRLCDGLKRERDLATLTLQDQEDLRMNAEKIIGSDENLFRIDWMPDSSKMTVQLIGKDDSNFDDFDMFSGRWQAYIDSFISDEDTKGSPKGKAKPPFLARNLRKVNKDPLEAGFYGRSGLEIRVCVRTYRLFFVADTEDVLIRHWTQKDIEDVERRSQQRMKAARKWLDRFEESGKVKVESSPVG